MGVKNMGVKMNVFLILFLCIASTAYATPKIQHWETENGARVYFVAEPVLPMVDVRVVFDAGAARDGKNGGVALMTNGMIPEGAGGWDANTIAERFEGVGARLGNSSHRDMSVFSVRTLTEKALFDQAIDTFSTLLNKPTFPQDAFEREKKRLLISLEQKKQSPDAISDEALFKNLYAGHPYASMPSGTTETVSALRRQDLRGFYQQYMVARNAIVVIVGDLERNEAEALAKRVIGDLPEGQVAAQLPAAAARTKAETIKLDFPSSQSHISLAQTSITRNDPDRLPLFLGNHVLGGSGLVSILSDEIREKRGLAYSSYSYFSPMRAEGPFIMALQTRNDQAEEALAVMRKTLSDFVANGPSKKQLGAAKSNITGGFALKMDSNKKILENVSSIAFYNLPLDYLDTYIDKVKAVSLEQVKDAFQRRVHPDKLLTVIVGGQSEQTPAQ